MLSTNNHEAVRAAALGGLGIGLLPEYQAIDDIEAGRLRRVLPDYTSEALPAYLVYPSRRHLPPRTRVVIDFLIEEVHRLRSRRADGVATPCPTDGEETDSMGGSIASASPDGAQVPRAA
jgi:hypothetical protein